MSYRIKDDLLEHGLTDRRFPEGFTAMEALIVCLLLGIVSMIGWPALNSAVVDSRLSGAAGEVVTALEFAQMTAMNSGRRTRVTIDSTTDMILVEQFTSGADFAQDILAEADVEGGSFATMMNPLNRGTNYGISLPGNVQFENVDITAVDFAGGKIVIFDTSGAPSSGGTVTLALGGSQVVVSVDSLAGKVGVSG